MDIRQWLDHIAYREPPSGGEEALGLPDPQPSEPERPTHEYRRKKRRTTSDSSIIRVRHHHRERSKAAKHAHSSTKDSGSEHADERHDSCESSQSTGYLLDQTVEKPYEKRARHKTKVDRYEPKTRGQRKKRKARDAREDRKSGPKRRKSHRSGNEGRTTGLVQSFQLKNGPKNNRLTVSGCLS